MASSSAVTIPTPGKSILKRPPPSQQSLFSRITRFLPTQNHSAPPAAQNGDDRGALDDSKPLKRAHFILPHISTIYPISSANPPSTPTLKEERRAIEEREAERRRRVVRGNSLEAEEWWNMDKVESFYRECCEGAEELPDPTITAAFKVPACLSARRRPLGLTPRRLRSMPREAVRAPWISQGCNSRSRRPLSCQTCSPSSGDCVNSSSESATWMNM